MTRQHVARRPLMRSAYILALVLFIATPLAANAGLIRFVPVGEPLVSGYIDFDDADFNGTNFQFLLNSLIRDLSLSANGNLFSLADVVTNHATIIDSTGATPRIVNGAGLLADNGTAQVAFFPDNTGDGDASLSLLGRAGWNPRWIATPVAVSEPASLALLLAGLAGLVARRRRSARGA